MPAPGSKIITPLDVAARRYLDRTIKGPKGPDGTYCQLAPKVDKYGYGFVKVNQRQWKAHRLVYTALISPIPDDLHLHHECGQRACVNVAHLEPRVPGEHVREHNPHKACCPKGHPYSRSNLYVRPNGSFSCRKCARASTDAWEQRRKLKAANSG
jgi:hypothetical protein